MARNLGGRQLQRPPALYPNHPPDVSADPTSAAPLFPSLSPPAGASTAALCIATPAVAPATGTTTDAGTT